VRLHLLSELGLDLPDLGRGHHRQLRFCLPIVVFEFCLRVAPVFVRQVSPVPGQGLRDLGRDHKLGLREVELPEAVIGPLEPAGHRVPLVEAGCRQCAAPGLPDGPLCHRE